MLGCRPLFEFLSYNRKFRRFFRCFILISMMVVLSCSKEDAEEWEGLVYPTYFDEPIQTVVSGRKFTKEGFYLGKKLFYDPILSRDSTISCGSCHQQAGAFSHIAHDVSHGIDNKLGIRNAPALQNLLWQPAYFHDGGVVNIDLISLAPIENPLEMDENINNIILKLARHPDYPRLFEQFYGTKEISSAKILTAITQFQAMLISSKSRYDEYLLGKAALTTEEIDGKLLFEEKCSRCHSGTQFSDFQYRNNGLSAEFDKDFGRYRISILESDKGKFKTPSLRNIEKTAPYMHNGSLKSLEEVLEHYNSGVKASSTLDTSLRNGIAMSKEEQRKIILFLKSLTDPTYLTDKRFSER